MSDWKNELQRLENIVESNEISHFKHLHEWVKIKGKCPVCKKKLKQEDISTLTELSN